MREKNRQKMLGYPDWAQKKWWVTPHKSMLSEYLKVLIGIKINIPNISARIHEVSTVMAFPYLNFLVFKDGRTIKDDVNPTPREGPDIEVKGVTSEGQNCIYRAEIITNFSFKHYVEVDKLRKDVDKLIQSKANRKFLVVLFENLVEEARRKCKSRKKNPIDLQQHNIEVLSIEKISGSSLLGPEENHEG